MSIRARIAAVCVLVVLTALDILGSPRGTAVSRWLSLMKGSITAQAPLCLKGDVNGDGVVDISDYFYLSTFLFSGGPAPVGGPCTADMNNDGLVNATDLGLLSASLCLKGDVNGDSQVNVVDYFYLSNFLFSGGPAPVGGLCTADMNNDGVVDATDLDLLSASLCLKGDVNGDGSVDISDYFYLSNFLFSGGPAPVGGPCTADMNNDGVVNATDLDLLSKIVCLKGDVNGDGVVNDLDVLYLSNFLNNGGPAPVGGPCTADLNGDGLVDNADLRFLTKRVSRATPTPTPAPCLKGDVNGDGLVNISDYFYLSNFLFSGGPAPVGGPCTADLNGDGLVDKSDLKLLKKLVSN
jgi:hypothetical protein